MDFWKEDRLAPCCKHCDFNLKTQDLGTINNEFCVKHDLPGVMLLKNVS
jgi:hypothetical protein